MRDIRNLLFRRCSPNTGYRSNYLWVVLFSCISYYNIRNISELYKDKVRELGVEVSGLSYTVVEVDAPIVHRVSLPDNGVPVLVHGAVGNRLVRVNLVAAA